MSETINQVVENLNIAGSSFDKACLNFKRISYIKKLSAVETDITALQISSSNDLDGDFFSKMLSLEAHKLQLKESIESCQSPIIHPTY